MYKFSPLLFAPYKSGLFIILRLQNNSKRKRFTIIRPRFESIRGRICIIGVLSPAFMRLSFNKKPHKGGTQNFIASKA